MNQVTERDDDLSQAGKVTQELLQSVLTGLRDASSAAVDGEATRLFFPNGIELIRVGIEVGLKPGAPVAKFEAAIAGKDGVPGAGPAPKPDKDDSGGAARRFALAPTDSYTLPYRAARDTEWISSPNAPRPETGTVPEGSRVHFARTPSDLGATWQDARLEDGTIRFVHPSDFEPA